MDATIDSFPIYKGQIAVEMALRKLGGQALPKVIWTHYIIGKYGMKMEGRLFQK